MGKKINNQTKKTKKIQMDIKYDLEELQIKKFKQFNDITFSGLSKINIFLGGNNTGKTSILEAIFMMSCGYNISSGLNLLTTKRDSETRGFYDYSDRVTGIFKETDELPYNFEFISKFKKNKKYHLSYNFSPASDFSTLEPLSLKSPNNSNILSSIYLGKLNLEINKIGKKYDLAYPNIRITTEKPLKIAQIHDILAHRDTRNDFRIYSKLKRSSTLDKFLDEMKTVFPIIKDIDYIPYPDGNSGSIYVITTDGKSLPLHSFGDGMRRWFSLLGNMIINQSSIHCIEEIDSTFHYEAQAKLSRNLVEYSNKYNNQLFITSHSIEFIDQFLETLYVENPIIKNDNDIVRIFTIKQSSNENTIDVWKLSGKEAYEKRLNYDLELR